MCISHIIGMIVISTELWRCSARDDTAVLFDHGKDSMYSASDAQTIKELAEVTNGEAGRKMCGLLVVI